MTSLGEDRVRVNFNPSSVPLVDQIKRKTAELIDLCESGKQVGLAPEHRSVEAQRLWALAMTKYEEAVMWAVKGATA